MGHEVESFVINPLRVPNLYLAYGFGLAFSLFRFRKVNPVRNKISKMSASPLAGISNGVKPDLVVADDLESSIAAVLIKSIFKIPFVFNFVDDYSLIASYEGRMLRYHALKYLEKVIPKLADLVIVVDIPKEEFCLDIGIPEEKLRVIPNGVDTSLFKPGIVENQLRDKLGLSSGRIVLFVGKMNKYYELDTVLRAIPAVLAKFPKTQFLFVGDGDNMDHLKGLSEHLEIENSVCFAGFRPPEEVPQIINLSDICVFPLPDSSALAIFEYMACAKPVVLPTGGTERMRIAREMIPEDCSVQVKNSPEGFAQGMISLLNDEAMAEDIGKKARELTLRLYDWNNLAKRYQEALGEALGQEFLSPYNLKQEGCHNG